MLCVLTWLPPSNETNMTQINASECPAELDNQSRYVRVTNLLYVIYLLLSCPKYIALGVGLFCFRLKTPTSKPSANSESNWKVRVGICLAGLFLTFFAFTSFLTITLGIVDVHMTANCTEEMVREFRLAYQFLSIPAHIASPIIRVAMVLTVFKVRAIWFNEKTVSQGTKQITKYSSDTNDDEKNAISRHFECVEKYEERVDQIKPFLQVFQTWFVFQWLHYFFQALINFTRTLHPWITGIHRPELTTAYYGIYTVYGILAFSIPHVCGLKINAYHQQYLREERNELLNKAGTKLQRVKAYLMKIEKNKYGDFVPRIRMTGIKIPLDSAGYTLGILFTIFALAGSFISFNA